MSNFRPLRILELTLHYEYRRLQAILFVAEAEKPVASDYNHIV